MSSSAATLRSKPRRSQAERREATRERLLEATIDCLVAHGATGATTAEIERRAGVSRGARLHHFPTKAGLLAAAVEQLYRGLRESFESQIKAHMRSESTADSGDRFAAAFRLLWTHFLDPRYAAVFELELLSRTDAELRSELREVDLRHHQNMQRRLDAYFPVEEGLRPDVRPPLVMETIHAAMKGLALRRVVFGEDVSEAQILDMVEDMARAWLQRRLQARSEAEGDPK